MSHPPRFPPALGVAVAVVSVSFAAPLFALADAPPVTASFWRLALAVLLLLPFTGACWRAWRTYATGQWAVVAAAGIALAAHFSLWVWSLQETTVAASTTLVTLQAVFVGLGGHFLLGDRLRARAWLGVLVAVLGATWIAAADGGGLAGGSLFGDLLALAAGVMSAVYFLIGRRLRRDRGLVEYVTPVYAAAALALLPMLWLPGQGVGLALGSSSFVFFVLLAAVPMLGGHTVANWTIRYLPAHVVATWILLEPVGASLLAWPLLGEVPSVWVVVGGAVALMGAGLTMQGSLVADEPAG